MHEKTFEYFGLNCFEDSAQVSKLLVNFIRSHRSLWCSMKSWFFNDFETYLFFLELSSHDLGITWLQFTNNWILHAEIVQNISGRLWQFIWVTGVLPKNFSHAFSPAWVLNWCCLLSLLIFIFVLIIRFQDADFVVSIRTGSSVISNVGY